ncbi:hypothetical protein BGZ65_003416, partial [Modicella reniformis]
HWYDKIVDVIVGDEGPDTKFALVCGKCFAHNGLALPQEIDDIQYFCPKCNFFNPSRRRTRMTMTAPGIQIPSTPEQTLLQAQNKPLPASRDPSPSPSVHRLPHPDHHHHHHHHQQQHHRQDESGLQEGKVQEPVLELPSSGERSGSDHSESDDIGFVSNWNDSDAGGVDHDEGDEEDAETDDTNGHIVDSGDGTNLTSTKAKKDNSGTKTKATATGKRKAKHI